MFDEDLFQYESENSAWGSNTTSEGFFNDGSAWENSPSAGNDSSGDSGFFNFTGDVTAVFTNGLKTVSNLGDAAMKTAAVFGKTAGQFTSLKDVYKSSKDAVTGTVNWSALALKLLPYALLVGGAVVLYKVAKD